MRTKSVLTMLILTAAVLTFTFHDAEAGFPAPPGVPGILIPPGLPGSSVNVRVDGYVPAPPGVNVQIDSGRPYYVESNRRVYIERERPSKHSKRYYKDEKKYYKDERKHYKKEKKHHEDRGNHYGHDNEGRGGHGR